MFQTLLILFYVNQITGFRMDIIVYIDLLALVSCLKFSFSEDLFENFIFF
jgi:hypothetical protein